MPAYSESIIQKRNANRVRTDWRFLYFNPSCCQATIHSNGAMKEDSDMAKTRMTLLDF
jgi:hypothetical protein